MHNDHVYNASFMPFLKNAKTNTYDHNSVNTILCHLFTSMVFLHIAVLLLTNSSYQIHTFSKGKNKNKKTKNIKKKNKQINKAKPPTPKNKNKNKKNKNIKKKIKK